MRRRPGIAGIQQRRDASVALRVVGEDAERQHLEAMRAQLGRFRASLEAFALKHKAEIRADPVFRAQFHKMCANVGVDPLASNKGFWTELLGFGDFYYELGVQVAEACLASKAQDGGLCELRRLMSSVLARRGRGGAARLRGRSAESHRATAVFGRGLEGADGGGKEGDPKRPRGVLAGPIRSDSNRGGGRRRRVRRRRRRRRRSRRSTNQSRARIRSYPVGCVSRSALEAPPPAGPGWTRERARSACEQLVKCGVALVDDGDPRSAGERLFWLPCVSARGTATKEVTRARVSGR